MEFDTLLSGTKWELLQLIARLPQAPTELAQKLNTSIANVSMQLRLLEVAGLVKKSRSLRSRRVIYSLVKEIAYIHAITGDLQVKRQLPLDADKVFIFKTWQLPTVVQGPLIQFYYNNQILFSSEFDIYFADFGDKVVKLIVSNNKKALPAKILMTDVGNMQFVIDVEFVTTKDIAKRRKITLLHKGSFEREE
jgi:DNA-binding transcriptional ArsR family regulator